MPILALILCMQFTQSPAPPPGEGSSAWFGKQPPLGAQDERRHLFRPYSAVELDYLAANYCENLLDKRLNITSYTHQGFDSNRWDAWHLQFPDDAARLVESLVWEDEYSGIARLETVRRIALGLLAAHIPGTQGYHFFRHRTGGKTYLIFDHPGGEGRLLLSTWGDEIQGLASIGFRARFGGAWFEQKDFARNDVPADAATPAVARAPEYWNESPFIFTRDFQAPDRAVRFTGRYWLSDEDKPIECAYESADAEELAIEIGEPGKSIPLLWDAAAPGIIEFGDRKTLWRSDKDGAQVMHTPECRYLVLRKDATWACPGYGSCLLVLWEGQPAAIEAVPGNGFGQIRILYAKQNAAVKGRVWLYPFHWINPDDFDYVFRNAESFLAQGRLLHNGFPSHQMINAIPSGLAAAAFLLSKYRDPSAQTVRIEALNTVDAFLEPEHKNRRFARLFLEVKAAAWMTQLGKLTNDAAIADEYAAWVKLTMERLLSPEAGYDGTAWPDGWTHFNNMKATWLAHEATGIPAYRDAYERAMAVYSIDAKGVYRHGEALKAPGGFEVYAGALPMAVWGHWGLKDRVDQLITLQVPNGWHHPEIPVADLWNDAGAGPWSQDDAQPDMIGYMLRGYDLPRSPKRLLPTGAFPTSSEAGAFEATYAPIVDNPFFLAGPRVDKELKEGELPPVPQVKTVEIDLSGQNATPPCITQRIDVTGAAGAALDMGMARGAYLVEASPDGEHWFPRLDTWCDKPTARSVDLSFLVGARDELVRTLTLAPPDDTPFLQSAVNDAIVRTHCRCVTPEGSLVYRFDLPGVEQCHIEFLLGNNYRIDLSRDGQSWDEALSPGQITPSKADNQKNAGWIRMVDASAYARSEAKVFVRFRNAGNDPAYGGEPAFLRRVTIYSAYKAATIHVRVRTAPYARQQGFVAEWLRLRTW